MRQLKISILSHPRTFLAYMLSFVALMTAIAAVVSARVSVSDLAAVTNETATEQQYTYLSKPEAVPAPPTISGTKSVCPSGCDYPTITAAIGDIQMQGLNGALVLELQSTYASTSETFPLTFTNLTGMSAINTITVRPASGATNLAITSTNTTATVDLNNANFVTIDGRAGGTGVRKDLTIENTTVTGVALRLINDASNNTVKYSLLKGVTTSETSGVVLFSTTTGSSGNDNNTIDNCDIGDGASTPTIAVYSFGTTATTTQNNSGNTISRCNIFNFHPSTTVFTVAVWLRGGNTNWTITGNSFYQTASRAAIGVVFGILIENPLGNNFAVTNNFLGGSAPNAGGTPWTTTGTTDDNPFLGIYLNVGTATPSSVQGNTIRNFVWTSDVFGTAPPGVWTGIFVEAGAVNIGTVAGNTIGSGTGTSSVSVTTSGSAGATFGIASVSRGTVVISNNTIGSITTKGTAANIGASLVGIQVVGRGTYTISNNTVGSITTPNSLNASNASTDTQAVTGILSSSDVGATITGNAVINLNNNAIDQGSVRGIVTQTGANMIIGNTVRNLSTTSRFAGAETTASVIGILQVSSLAGNAISRNVVHSLSNTALTGAVWVTGIIYFSGATGTSTIDSNLVHSLSVSSSSALSAVNGIHTFQSNSSLEVQNNMVRVGIDASGASTAGSSIIRGIYDNGTGTNRNYYHNSVYVGGTQTAGAANTFAFEIAGATARTLQNNIFVNTRSNSGGSGKHYALKYVGTSLNPSGLTSNNNIFFVSGTGSSLGFYDSADRASIQAWRCATREDEASAFVDPLFVNPTAGTPDLHLQASNPAERGGATIASVTNDFDGEARINLTPTDIGADAANFGSSSGDIFAPATTYGVLPNGSTANRVLSDFATITDNLGVSDMNLPRLYFKKSTDADNFTVSNSSLGNGWKFVTASNSSSPYGFTIDYSIINGGSVTGGDTIQYFVVAQDSANNFSSNPAGAGSLANPPVLNINSKPCAGVNSYNIVGTINGTKTVCASGCDYVSLTGTLVAGGIFADINAKVVTGNLVINISGDLTENGTNGLNQLTEEGAGNYSVTIQPDPSSAATMKTISGNGASGMIRLNGADRVIIDGRHNNVGRFMTFRNAATTIELLNDASNNIIRSSIIEGGTTSFFNGVLFFSTSVNGNNNNTVTDNQIRSLSTAAGKPKYLIYKIGFSSPVYSTNNTISNNELFDFADSAIGINSLGDESWTISGNNIYGLSTQTGNLTGVNVSGGRIIVTQNVIHDLVTSGISVTGISVSGPGNTTVSSNRTYAFPGTAGNLVQQGIQFNGSSGGTLNLINNQITIMPSGTFNQTIKGIVDNGVSGSTFNSYFNTVLIGGTATGTNPTWACLRSNGVVSTHTSRNNICFNNRTGGTGSHFAAGNQSTSGSYSSNHNLFAGTGTTTFNFMDSGTSQSGTPVSFATWQSGTGGDANSQAGNPGDGFSTGMFVNPSIGDLHIVAGGNPLVFKHGDTYPRHHHRLRQPNRVMGLHPTSALMSSMRSTTRRRQSMICCRVWRKIQGSVQFRLLI